MRTTQRQPALQTLLKQPAVQAAILKDDDPLLAELGRWLGQLCLLHGVPFNLLVPDARMLPMESIRFFFIDQNWLDSLVDGALSIGSHTSQDASLLEVLRPQAHANARASAHGERTARLAVRRGVVAPAPNAETPSPPAPAATAPVWSGFLLRSAAVADWPGLTVSATDAKGSPLQPLRIERVAPTVLLVVFAGVGQAFDIAKPSQALHFGLEDGDLVFVRSLGEDGVPIGTQLVDEKQHHVTVAAPFRDATRGVLDVVGLAGKLGTATGAGSGFGAAAFGLELIAGAERQEFTYGS